MFPLSVRSGRFNDDVNNEFLPKLTTSTSSTLFFLKTERSQVNNDGGDIDLLPFFVVFVLVFNLSAGLKISSMFCEKLYNKSIKST